MTMPGFFGEASLYISGNSYVSAMRHGAERTIYPASYIDQKCSGGCLRDCSSECAGSGKAFCIRQCALDNAQCRSECTRQGNPPPPSCPPGLTDCGGTCVDLSGDPSNCGACNQMCTSGVCCSGTCGTDCGGGHCCPTGVCCNTAIGLFCCDHVCHHTLFGNYCT